MTYKKKIVFITGTRADYGKIKSVINILKKKFKIYIYVTGMHMLSKYGGTYIQIKKENKSFANITLYKNQYTDTETTGIVFGRTISNFSKYLLKVKPDMVLVHGDRYESLAAAISASSINILVGHIEGGELSGNIDEHLRHAISKLSNLHFVSNKNAKKNLIQMGEKNSTIFEVGSPDIDIMNSKNLPNLDSVKKRYNIKISNFGILIFHPFNYQNLEKYKKKIMSVVESIKNSKENYIIIYPNNDYGNNVIIEMYRKYLKEKNFKIIRSCRFEYFLTLLKNSKLIIGNSSAGIREAPFYGVPSINIGERQKNRFFYPSILNLNFEKKKILNAINKFKDKKFQKTNFFGNGKSDEKIYSILSNKKIWKISRQKQLILKDF